MMKNGLPLLAICVLILVATGIGLFYHPDVPPIRTESLRGQSATFVAAGPYRYNPVFFAREGAVWDAVNLFLALPLLVLSALFALRDNLRGRLLLGGMLAYFWYVYLGTALMNAFNDLFLVYVGIVALCAVAFVQNAARIDVDRVRAACADRFPRRILIGYSLGIAAVLVGLWTSRVAAVMRTGMFPPEYAGINTLGSQALDLGLLVPLALSTAVLLGKRSPWGYYLASITVSMGFMMSVTIPCWIVVPLVQDGQARMGEAVPFFVVSLVGITVAVLYLSRLRPASRARTAAAMPVGR